MTTVALVLALATWMARRMSRGLESLVDTARSIRSGATGVRASEDLPGELREVAREFNVMLDSNSRHIDFYAALSRTNGAIVRSADTKSLFDEICRICVAHGHATIAYVSLVDGDTLNHVAWAGPADRFVHHLQVRIADRSAAGSGLSGLAAYTGELQVSNDVEQDPRTMPWRALGRAIGTQAIAACPFHCNGKVFGTLTLHMDSVGFFDDRVTALLDEMAKDISFALDNFARARALEFKDLQLAGLVDTAMDAIIAVDASFQIRLFNRAAADMFKVGAADAIGTPIERFVPARSRKAHGELMKQFRLTGNTARPAGMHNLSAIRCDGTEFPIEASISRLGAGELVLMTVVIRDATELREAQAARVAQVTAQSANRAKTEFLSRMSHELRTPLNAVLGFSQLLQGDLVEPLTVGQNSQVEHIRLAGWHLLALIDDVLDVSKIEGGHVVIEERRVDLLESIETAIRFNQPMADELQVSIIPSFQGTGPVAVWSDARRLRQVMINLLSNAIKYNHPGGTVEIRVRGDQERATVEVIDTGVGMDPGQLQHLFEPFNRLGRDRGVIEGTGLGLALARQLVQLMRGTIDVRSTVGKGTVVRLVLRTHPEVSAAARPPQETTVPPALDATLPTGVVLYIEDNPVNTLLVEQLLLRWPNVTFLHAETGHGGLAIARAAPIDLILLDMRLPDMDGLAVLSALRSHASTRSCRVVAVSASAMPEEMEAATRAGAMLYWTKPLDFSLFLQNMRELLARTPVPEGQLPDVV